MADGRRQMADGRSMGTASAHDVRDPKGAIDAVCDLVTGRSLLPNV